MNQRPYTLVVLSAQCPGMTTQQAYDTTLELIALLSPFPCTVGEGSYRGVREASVICQVTNPEDLAVVKHMAKHFKQESILVVDTNDQAYLWNLAAETSTELGLWTETSAPGHGDWTRVGTRYFTTMKRAETVPVPEHVSFPYVTKDDDKVYAMHGIDDGPNLEGC